LHLSGLDRAKPVICERLAIASEKKASERKHQLKEHGKLVTPKKGVGGSATGR